MGGGRLLVQSDVDVDDPTLVERFLFGRALLDHRAVSGYELD